VPDIEHVRTAVLRQAGTRPRLWPGDTPRSAASKACSHVQGAK
jgi:hypothetical protein